MHASRVAELVLWAGAVAGTALAVVGWRVSMPAGPPVADAVRLWRPPPAHQAEARAVMTAAGELAQHDPFRLARRPAAVAFGTPEPAPRAWTPATLSPAFPAARPRLAVQGFVGGRGGWEAVLAGVPGREAGVLVRAGDTLSGLRVRRVTRDTLVVAGADTVWRLTPGGPGGVAGAGIVGAPFAGLPGGPLGGPPPPFVNAVRP